MRSKFPFPLKTVLYFLTTAFLFASCSSVKYTYYNKHKVPGSAPEEVKLAKAIPAKPFLMQAETKLKEIADVKQTEPVTKTEAKNMLKEIRTVAQEPEKIASGFDINKFFSEHKFEIKKKGGDGLDDRTTIIILLVILILVLLALVGDGLLWLLWLALLVLLILALIKYLGLFG